MRFPHLLLFFSPLLLSADVITTSTSCSARTGTYTYANGVVGDDLHATSPSSCSVSGDIHLALAPGDPFPASLPGYTSANATASGSYSLFTNGVSGRLAGEAGATPLAQATATATFSDTFTMDGPERTGVIRGTFLPGTFRYSADGSGARVSALIVSPVLPYSNFSEAAPTMTVQLGQPFTLTIIGSVDVNYDANGSFTAPFNLAFFEADGVTPVALREVAAAPEPSTWASMVGGLAILGYWGRRRVRN